MKALVFVVVILTSTDLGTHHDSNIAIGIPVNLSGKGHIRKIGQVSEYRRECYLWICWKPFEVFDS
jgi:hypothetical protein